LPSNWPKRSHACGGANRTIREFSCAENASASLAPDVLAPILCLSDRAPLSPAHPLLWGQAVAAQHWVRSKQACELVIGKRHKFTLPMLLAEHLCQRRQEHRAAVGRLSFDIATHGDLAAANSGGVSVGNPALAAFSLSNRRCRITFHARWRAQVPDQIN
jgi:hypothetical protein